MGKLTKQISFNKKHYIENINLKQYVFLYNYLHYFFPNIKEIENIHLEIDDKNKKNQHLMRELEKHTRDEKWLTLYVSNKIKSLSSENIKLKNIHYFVKHDPKFNAERVRYEQDIVHLNIKSLINEFNNSLSINWVQTNFDQVQNAFEQFRNLIINRNTKLGIDHHSIESSIEKNAFDWRNKITEKVFINQYLKRLTLFKDYTPIDQYKHIIDTTIANKQKWVNLNEYIYYKKHHEIIDELGLKADSMNLEPQIAENAINSWQQNYEKITQPLTQNYKDFIEQIR